jgi:hypothetical protein
MFTFKVTPDGDESYTLVADSRDVLIFEKTSRGKNLLTWRDSMSMVDLYRLAHIAATRQGRYEGKLNDFERDVVIDIQDDEEDESSDPTQPSH